MNEKYMDLGKYIRKKRQDDPREITLSEMSKILGISVSFLSEIECGRKKTFGADMIEKFSQFLGLSHDEKSRLYDLAAKEKNSVPEDIVDEFMYEPVGDVVRYLLREYKKGDFTEDDWKQVIRNYEEKKGKTHD